MKARLLFAAVFIALLAVAIPAISQQPAQTIINVQRIQVKADRVAEFLDLAKQSMEPIKKAAPADLTILACRTVVGNGNEFWRFMAISRYADRDGENPMNKFSPPQDRVGRNARIAQTIERSQTWIERVIGDLAVPRSGTANPAYARLARVRIRPGAADDYINNYKTDIIPVIKKINGNVRVHRIAFGGNTNEFAVYTLFDKWAELDDNTTFLNALGGEAARKKLTEKMSPMVVNSEQYILQFLPDLSYVPAQAAPAPKR